MSDRLKRLFSSKRRPVLTQDMAVPKLREFIYLDEVSLRSLLSSLKGEVTEGTSEQQGTGFQGEVIGKMSVGAAIVGKADLTSKYQTSNSSTLQTSRKATVQSWFGELHAYSNARLVEPVDDVAPLLDQNAIAGVTDPNLAILSSQFARGEMIEFRIRLAADYVFHLGTMAEEFSGIAEDFPQLVSTPQAKAVLGDTYLVSRLLSRLLAGLIPVRCEAVDHVVVEVGGQEYVVHRSLVQELDLAERKLELVGVTEHLAYWKDIRRVLFSGAECTMLARVARAGLHDSWTPVKLAELFRPFTPDLVGQISRASRDPFLETKGEPAAAAPNRLEMALRHYADAMLLQLPEENRTIAPTLDLLIHRLASSASTAAEQRAAFALVRDTIVAEPGEAIDPDRDLALRNEARQSADLPLITNAESQAAAMPAAPEVEAGSPRLLDVEVIAIYW